MAVEKIKISKVKLKIVSALFNLLKTDSFNKIKISQIIEVADVSRPSYYRNFSDKISIINYFIKNIYNWKVVSKLINSNLNINFDEVGFTKFYEISLQISLEFKEYFLILDKNNFSGLIVDLTTESGFYAIGNMSNNSIDKYLINYLTGFFCNIRMQWLKNGAKESIHDMAVFLTNVLKDNVIKKLEKYQSCNNIND
ncbi:TetR/AcrR family transcriptional regulator [Ureaplasma parvum]|uniref:TetR/AcrR family transcriptional regulator n=1 Tax=Ureaplasma parvum TaxID=134821 RepID=UPI00114E6B3C|nr:TetR/AcrR family transcriptional regulator [Ureaplasma parvum]QDI64279.1 TetR/AcrR family transcriptional regulator [Ureaplasma parvum]